MWDSTLKRRWLFPSPFSVISWLSPSNPFLLEICYNEFSHYSPKRSIFKMQGLPTGLYFLLRNVWSSHTQHRRSSPRCCPAPWLLTASVEHGVWRSRARPRVKMMGCEPREQETTSVHLNFCKTGRMIAPNQQSWETHKMVLALTHHMCIINFILRKPQVFTAASSLFSIQEAYKK